MAVAAAALLCIGSGFIFRCCVGRHAASAQNVTVVDVDSVADRFPGDSVGGNGISGDSVAYSKQRKRSKSGEFNGKRARRAKRKNSAKTYPSRSPLDEPCDE